MFVYLYFNSGGIAIHSNTTSDDFLLVVLHFREPKFGPNMSLSAIMSSLVTGQFGSCFQLIIFT